MKGDQLTDYDNPDSLGSKMRARRLAPLLGLIRKVYQRKGSVSILDVGGRETYWKSIDSEFLKKHRVKITILNLPCELVGEECELFSYAVGDACNLAEYQNHAFDIVHSNSVIEHVGDWGKVKAFAREVNRVAPNLFVQTPYYWFPVEPHFLKPIHHWLPKPLRVSMWMRFQMGQRSKAKDIDDAMHKFDEEPYLLDKRMFGFLFPDCKILKERFMFFTKSMVAFRDQNTN